MSFIEDRLAEAKYVFETWPKEKQDAMRRFVSGEPPPSRRVCICGFLHPVRPQAEWTDEDIRAVVAHQNFHSPMKD
jgi:hypothetical protein